MSDYEETERDPFWAAARDGTLAEKAEALAAAAPSLKPKPPDLRFLHLELVTCERCPYVELHDQHLLRPSWYCTHDDGYDVALKFDDAPEWPEIPECCPLPNAEEFKELLMQELIDGNPEPVE